MSRVIASFIVNRCSINADKLIFVKESARLGLIIEFIETDFDRELHRCNIDTRGI